MAAKNYRFVTECDIKNLVDYAVEQGRIAEISEKEIESLTCEVNRIMHMQDEIEMIPYGRSNYQDIVDEVFGNLVLD